MLYKIKIYYNKDIFLTKLKKLQFLNFNLFHLPIKKPHFTLLKGPFVHKKSRDQYEFNIKQCFILLNIQNKNDEIQLYILFYYFEKFLSKYTEKIIINKQIKYYF